MGDAVSPSALEHMTTKLPRLKRNMQRAYDRRVHLRALPGTIGNRQREEDETDLIVLLAVEIREIEDLLKRWQEVEV